ncbi:MAG: hypothetical protein ACRYFS_09385 [Janthinobacterium lividum]
MTITLDLAPEEEAQLNVIAARQGQNADTVAYELFASALASSRKMAALSQPQPAGEWTAEFRAKYHIPADAQPLSDEELQALNPENEDEAICLGLDASFAGRVTPLAEWSAKVRARHNLPEGGKVMSHEEVMLLL